MAVELTEREKSMRLEDLEILVRTYNCLRRVGIETIPDLYEYTEADLLLIPNFGRKSLDELRMALRAALLPELGIGGMLEMRVCPECGADLVKHRRRQRESEPLWMKKAWM